MKYDLKNNIKDGNYVELEKGVKLSYNNKLYTITQYVEKAEIAFGIDLYELENETKSKIIYMTDFEIRQQCIYIYYKKDKK